MVSEKDLFAQYCALQTKADRQSFALAHPRLLWIETIRRLGAEFKRPRPSGGMLTKLLSAVGGRSEASPENLVKLDQFRLSFRTIDDYPIGPGPIEKIIATSVGTEDKIARSASAEVHAIVGPPYLRILALRGATGAQSNEWQAGLLMARCAAEAALVFIEGGGSDNDVWEAIIGYLQASMFSLGHELDPSIRSQALLVANRAIASAEQENRYEILGAIYQALGSLHSDIWLMPIQGDGDAPIDLRASVERVPSKQRFFSGSPEEHWPGALESLAMASQWYQRAVPYRVGAARGLSYKAIVHTNYTRSLLFGEDASDADLPKLAQLAAELLAKHPARDYHLQTLESISKKRGWNLQPPSDQLAPEHAELLSLIAASYEPGPDDSPVADRRREAHASAVADLQRVLRHGLPWALYLRNFDYANDIRMVGDPIVSSDDSTTRIVVPQISYSIVDHKALELFGEGVVAVGDPRVSETHLLSTIPRLSLRNDAWLDVVRRLATASHGIIFLLDSPSPGVRDELSVLQGIDAAKRTLVVCGNEFRKGARLPDEIDQAFPYKVDWLDFSYSEQHHDMGLKAHAIVQRELTRFVRSDVRPTVAAWRQATMRKQAVR